MASPDENARLAALRRYAVLDMPDAPFDRITQLTARWFEAPIALITLVGAERQWFKSSYGLDREATPRAVAFCAHNIRDDDVLIVEDAAEDARFADNPLVTGDPGIRFYAGAPLITPDGYRIGALCAIDTAPRRIDDPDELASLAELARIAMDEIEAHAAHPHHAEMLESITDGFFAVDTEWRFTYINGQAERLLQRSRDELLGQNVWEQFPEAVDLAFYEQYHRAVDTGESVQFEAHFPPLEAWFRVNAYPYEGGLSVYFDDVTARRAAQRDLEQSLARTRQILETTIDGYLMYDAGGAILDVNPAYCAMLGYTETELLGMNLSDLEAVMPAHELHDELRRYAAGQHETPGNKRFETKHRHKDGRLIDVEVSVSILRRGDGPRIYAFVRDVTARKAAQVALREREAQLRSINNHVQEGIYRSTPDEGLVYVNNAFAQLFGYDDPAALLALDDLSQLYADPADRDAFVRKVHANEHLQNEEVAFRRADGSTFWGLLSATTAFDDDGAVLYRDGAVLDITDRKQAEDALRAREEYLSVTLRSIGDAVLATDVEGRITEMNPIAETLTGWSLDEAAGRRLVDIFRIHNAKTGAPVENPVEKVLREGQIVGLANHTVLTARDGTAYQIADSAAPIRTAEGNLLGVVMVFRDVTEQYEQDEALEAERQRLELALLGGDLGLWDLNLNEGRNVVNARWAEMLGYTLDEVGDSQAFFETHVHPDDLERAYAALERHARGETPYLDVEIRMRHKDGTWRWILDRGKIVAWNADGSPRRVVGTHMDVTARKEREEALRESKIALEQAQAIARTGNGTIDLQRNMIDMSEEAGRLLGLDASVEQPVEAFMALVHPADRDFVAAEFERVRAGKVHDAEYRITPKGSDTVRWLRGQGRPRTDDGGTVTHVFSTIADITERKTREEALRESRVLLEESQRIAHLGHWDWDVETGSIYWSDETYRIFGYAPQEIDVTIETYFEAIPPPDRERVRRVNEASFVTGEMEPIEHPIVRPDGSERVVELTGVTMEENAEGAPTRVVGTVLDVTARKRMEDALRTQERLYRELVQTTSAILWRGDPETFAFTYISPQVEDLLGYTPEAWMADPDFWVEHIHPDDRDWAPAYCQQATRELRRHRFDYRMIDADGETVWLRDIVNVIVEDGEAVELVGVMIDITELKETEQALARSLNEKQRILETTLDGYMLHDMDGIIVDVNPAYCAMVGYDRDALIGMDIRDLDVGFTREALDRRIANYPDVVERRFETQHVHRDGHRVDLDVSAVMMEDEQGRRLVNAFLRDVTARKRAEQALRESEQRYRTLVERSHDAIYIYRGARLLFVNDRVCALTGYAEDELLSMNVFDLLHPDDRDRVRGYAQRRADGSAPDRYEARLVRKDGAVRYGDFSVQAITYQGEHAAIGSIRDVTQRRNVERALRESEQRFRALAEETTDIVTRLAPDGTQLYVSPAIDDVLGYAPDALIGTPFQPLIHPDDQEQVAAHIHAAQHEGEKVQFEYRIRHAEGHYVWVETAGQQVPGDGGDATLIASTRSVAERKAAEQALRRRERRVEALYEAMRVLTQARTDEQVAEHILALIADTLGYPIAAVRYRSGDGVLTPVAISAKSQELMPARPDYDAAGESLVARAFRRGDTARYADLQRTATRHDRGAVRAAAYVPIGTYGIISVGSTDVDGISGFDVKLIEILARNAEGVLERIEREDALRAARDEAEEMNRLKSAFLANMSHEIRTPLTSIIGFAEVLGARDLGEANQFADLIRQGGQRLLDTLNSVLDLSQLEAGSMQLAPDEVNVTHTTRATVDFFTPKARDKDLTLSLEAPDDAIYATVDEAALHRILSNLLSNAVKFTHPGGRIAVRLQAQPEHFVVEVEDTGVGIDADFVPHLFDAFKQESSGDSRAFEGSGLGLTIIQELLEQMGGAIAVETAKGEGTCFTVRLPYAMDAAEQAPS